MTRHDAGAEWPPDGVATAACRRVLGHGENFPVLSFLVPRRLASHVVVLYAYCRSVDDLGDEAEGDRSAALERRRNELVGAWSGLPATDPILRATAASASVLALPLRPYLDLIDANRLDQARVRFSDFDALQAYCRKSADPVGRLYLALHGIRDEALDRLSDRICTGLQLVNFLQDVAEDWSKRDRIYLTAEAMNRFGVREGDLDEGPSGPRWPQLRALLDFERARARGFLEEGLALTDSLRGRLAASVWTFTQAGLLTLDLLEAVDGDVWRNRPAPSSIDKARLLTRAIWWLARRGG